MQSLVLLCRRAAMSSFVVAALLLFPKLAGALPFVLAGPDASLAPRSFSWGWSGSNLQPFRTALESDANFGPTGTVGIEIETRDLTVIDALALADVDGFVSAWWHDTDAAPYTTAVIDFFLGGGDLYLLQDDSRHDAIGAALGLSALRSDGSVSNGTAPLFDGVFGTASDVTQHYNTGRVDETAVTTLGGRVGARNASGQVTAAYWLRGEWAPGAGGLFVLADIDMWATTGSNGAQFSAAGDPLNSNAVFALNSVAAVDEPAVCGLAACGLAGLFGCRSRREA